MVVVTPTTAEADQLAEDIGCFLGPSGGPGRSGPGAGDGADADRVVGDVVGPVALLPAWDTLPFERVSPEVHTMGQRLAVLWHLLGAGSDPPAVVVASVRALLQSLPDGERVPGPVSVASGSELDASALVQRLVSLGYRREHQVDHRGELAVRGGIIDVFPSTSDLPVRIDLWGDEVDRLAVFDPSDQRSVEQIDRVLLFGCREVFATDASRARAETLIAEAPWGRATWERFAAGELFEGMESWLPWLQGEQRLATDFLGPAATVVLCEPRRVRDRAVELSSEESALADALASTWGFSQAPGEDDSIPRLHLPFERLLADSSASVLSLVTVAEGPDQPSVAVRGFERTAGDPTRLAEQVASLSARGSLTLCSSTDGGAHRLSELLGEHGVVLPVVDVASAAPGARVVRSPLSRGFALPDLGVAVMAESDLTGRRVPHRRARARARATGSFFDDLQVGAFVVHRQHGIARFAGVTTRTMGGATRDYLLLEFRGSDRLYLPVDQIEAITPYAGGETPTLSRMGGAEWQRARARARAAAAEIAEELVALYRRRLEVSGHAFSADTPWQRELEASFPYVETVDQLRAVAEVKADMEQPRPMDRLVCGDVGFGKTEVAVRAAFKAVQDGTQVAVLVPTTLLATQHVQTFSDRFAGFPVRVEALSRFLTPGQADRVVAGLADGSVDVVIGTHRLLSSDVRFKRLGLLVVDEEQRFGVTHKEAIKQLSQNVDVLTLTASPIPRTLEMALTGIRDLSLVNTPPADRRPILTYVGEYDDAAVSEALRRELLRDGQTFFVHNRIVDIEAVADRLRRLVPEARVAVAHGQMDEGSLEQVVLDFWEQKHDVLVCTTIIESGIDMPSVNTLVVDRADLLGLGQLHQIRGRVGRSGQRAYAYLFHPSDRVLTEQAYERLKTVGEFSELGAGFKIAMRDLEIRGAGNLLGANQSGHIAAVGYDLYVQLVAEAVAEAKGEPRPEVPTVSIDVPGDAHLPAEYVPGEDTRLEAYRRVAGATTSADVDDIAAEWLDRFGPLPEPAEGLLSLARLRVECLRIGITEVMVTPTRPGGPRRPIARIAPAVLATSAQVRLRRLAPEARYREDVHQLQAALSGRGRPADELRELMASLWPERSDGVPAGR